MTTLLLRISNLRNSTARTTRRFLPGTICGTCILAGGMIATLAQGTALKLHPDNPHYFLWRGQPTVLITSGEHYGAVLNLDFDFREYLDTLAADGLNLTRTFTGGPYVEPPGAFNIVQNTLAPALDRYITPWATKDTTEGARTSRLYDLNEWNSAYFQRLREFVSDANERGIIVEVNLFCPFYDESQWKLSPFHPANNVNKLGSVARTNVYTLDNHGGLLPVQERMVRKLVEELRDFGNVYYEICNEPYFGGVTLAWQRHIADVIRDAQKSHPSPKLISQNITNQSARIEDPHPDVSIFNFHYATPPDAVALNYHLGKPLGDNETGFRGTNNTPYRSEAWEFILAGGALYNNLDYSFTAGHEDGTFVYPVSQPGGGNPQFRKELKILRDFMTAFDFVKMAPDKDFISLPSNSTVRTHALSDPGKAYGVYVFAQRPSSGAVVFEANLPAGIFEAEWIDTKTGLVAKAERLDHSGGRRELQAPGFSEDIALRLRKRPL